LFPQIAGLSTSAGTKALRLGWQLKDSPKQRAYKNKWNAKVKDFRVKNRIDKPLSFSVTGDENEKRMLLSRKLASL